MLRFKLLFIIAFLFTQSFVVFSQSQDSTENWKQYSSSLAGFAIKYPSDWQVGDEEAKGQVWRVAFASPGVRDDDVVLASSIMICSKPKTASFKTISYCRERDDHLSDGAKNKVVSDKTFNLNGIEIRRKQTEDKYRPQSTYIYAFFSTKDRDFLVSSIFERSFNLDRYVPIFDQMLATFQASKELTVSTFKDERYDFAITYPASWKNCELRSQHAKENAILLIVPQEERCYGTNFISVSRNPALSGKLLSGYELKELIKKNGFERFNPFLDVSSAQGERLDGEYIYRQSYFFTNFLKTYDLIEITEQFENSRNDFQKQAKEILATTQRHLKSN